MIRVLLADHRPLLRVGLQTVLAPLGDQLLLVADNHTQDWPRLCRQLNPDVLLLNAHLPGLQLEQTLTEIATVAPQTHVLLLLEPDHATQLNLHQLLQIGGG